MKTPAQPDPVTSRLSQCGNDARPFQLESLSITEIETFTALRIRAVSGMDPERLIDMGLPTATGHCEGRDPVTLCLNPREWLRISESATANVALRTDPATDSGFHQWNETDGLGMLRVAGNAATWLLRKNSGLDFRISPETPDHCVQCKFGKIRLLVHCRRVDRNSVHFNLIVDRSLMNYLWTLLISTAPHAIELHQKFPKAGDLTEPGI